MKLLAPVYGVYNARKNGKVYNIAKYLNPEKAEELPTDKPIVTNLKASSLPESNNRSEKRKTPSDANDSAAVKSAPKKPIIFKPSNRSPSQSMSLS